MSLDTPSIRTLRRAAAIMGGENRLAERWGVPLRELEDWLAGVSAPPNVVYFKALCIVAQPGAGAKA